MALTASATKKCAILDRLHKGAEPCSRRVQDDIVQSLDLLPKHLYRVVHSFNRGNLFYEVRYVRNDFPEKLNDTSSFIHNLYRRKQRRDADLTVNEARSICGIIYCRAKSTCDMVAEGLRKKGINAAAYHRGMKDTDAERNADLWRNAGALAKDGKKRVDCIGKPWYNAHKQGIQIDMHFSCDSRIWVRMPHRHTVQADFSTRMGIDTPSCRYIIHFDVNVHCAAHSSALY